MSRYEVIAGVKCSCALPLNCGILAVGGQSSSTGSGPKRESLRGPTGDGHGDIIVARRRGAPGRSNSDRKRLYGGGLEAWPCRGVPAVPTEMSTRSPLETGADAARAAFRSTHAFDASCGVFRHTFPPLFPICLFPTVICTYVPWAPSYSKIMTLI